MDDHHPLWQQFLRKLYRDVQGMLEDLWTSKTANLVRGGKVLASALPVDGTSIVVSGGAIGTSSHGTVTSITVTVPSVLAVTPATITGSGTFAFSLATQVANTVWAGPTSGIAAAPTFRGLVPADIPSLDAAKIATGTFAAGRIPIDGTTILVSGGVLVAAAGGSTITAQGDLIVGNASSLPARLPLDAAAGRVPGAVGADVAWITPAAPAGFLDPTTADGDLIYRKKTARTSLVVGVIGDSISTPSYNCVADAMADLSINGVTVTAVNAAVSGTSTSDWLPGGTNYTAAIAACAAAGVRAVSIMLGTNDARAAVRNSAATYASNLLTIVADLVGRGYIVWLHYPPYAVPGSNAGDQDATANTLRQAYQLKINQIVNGVTVLQGDTKAYLYFAAHAGELSDGIHPTSGGQIDLGQLWADAMQAGVAALTQQTTLQRLTLGTGLSIAGGVLNASAPTVAHKGDIQGYGGAPANIVPSGTDGNVLTEDSTAPTGWKAKPISSAFSALSSLTDVTIRDLHDGDALVWVAVLGTWMNSTGLADFGANVVDDTTGNLVLDDASGFQVISDPLPTLVINDANGYTVVDNLTGANVVNG